MPWIARRALTPNPALPRISCSPESPKRADSTNPTRKKNIEPVRAYPRLELPAWSAAPGEIHRTRKLPHQKTLRPGKSQTRKFTGHKIHRPKIPDHKISGAGNPRVRNSQTPEIPGPENFHTRKLPDQEIPRPENYQVRNSQTQEIPGPGNYQIRNSRTRKFADQEIRRPANHQRVIRSSQNDMRSHRMPS